MLNGIGVSSGYGIGKVIIIKENVVEFKSTETTDINTEKQKLSVAIDEFILQNNRLADNLKKTVGDEESNIILGHNMMINDPYMISQIKQKIENGQSAQSAVSIVCDDFANMFLSSDDVTKQRATDINDIKNRLLRILSGSDSNVLSNLPKDTVIVTHELTPSVTATLDKQNVAAIITEIGSKTSHAAILARAMQIPAVLGVDNATSQLQESSEVIVNGATGEIICNPNEKTKSYYIDKQNKYIKEVKALNQLIGQPTTTKDGLKVDLFANIGTEHDAKSVHKYDAEGVGLFRTEFMFMDRKSAPNEEEQFKAYKKVVADICPNPVIIRTIDIGGDKDIDYLGLNKEQNPFMGFRAIRYCLYNTDFFKTQLKAILRAGMFGDLSIMLPLITGVEELRNAKAVLAQAMKELDDNNIPYKKDIKIGVMIETPSAAVTADILANEADFFSIGTNDLIGYTLCADRGNSSVEYLYSAYSLSVLRLIKHIISAAHKAGIPCGMCGESASDPMMIPMLISFGLDEYSVSLSSILSTRKQIHCWTKQQADKVAEYIMNLDTTKDIKAELKRILDNKSKE